MHSHSQSTDHNNWHPKKEPRARWGHVNVTNLLPFVGNTPSGIGCPGGGGVTAPGGFQEEGRRGTEGHGQWA